MSEVATRPARSKRPLWAALGAISILILGAVVAFARRSPDPEAVWQRARAAFEARDFPRAEAEMARLNQLREPTILDRMLRAQLEMARGDVDEAIADLKRVPDDHKMAPQAWLQVGQLELRRNRYVPAEAAFRKALEIDPKLVQALRELVYIYGMQLRRAELNETFGTLSTLEPLTYADVFLWCLTRGVTWEPEEIASTLARCIEADPDDRWARLGRADALRDLGRFDEAESVLAPLPDSDPDARAARVRIALDRGDPARAEELLEAGPSDHLGLALLRGRLALVQNRGDEAVRQFRIAFAKAPNLRESVLGLGQALQTTGDQAAATPILEEARKHEQLGSLIQKAAVQANRSDTGLIRELGEACAAIGRLPEARAWYNLAISRDPLDIRAQQALARLKPSEGLGSR
ncbi:tetratricopeptide repeat protein [Tundrisphaera lichenicola]|uniref:tetratricopeptide repeat protein n=1 Tax=Tundrisphaera lichenicola TaxID=2029860 RepID=UPI003EB8576C